MTTAVLERQIVSQQPRTWPELHQAPEKSLRVPLVLRKGQRVKMPRGCSCQLVDNPPATVWPRVMEAIEDFGVNCLYIYAPKEAFRETKKDPAIIAEKGGRLYLVAVWQ